MNTEKPQNIPDQCAGPFDTGGRRGPKRGPRRPTGTAKGLATIIGYEGIFYKVKCSHCGMERSVSTSNWEKGKFMECHCKRVGRKRKASRSRNTDRFSHASFTGGTVIERRTGCGSVTYAKEGVTWDL